MTKKLNVQVTREQALRLGLVFCKNCPHPPNNHFCNGRGPGKPCAHCPCKKYEERVVDEMPKKPAFWERAAVLTKKIDRADAYFMIVPDNAAGLPNRFTLYRIPSSPSGRMKILGRELPLAHCRRIVRENLKAGT